MRSLNIPFPKDQIRIVMFEKKNKDSVIQETATMLPGLFLQTYIQFTTLENLRIKMVYFQND